MTPSSDLFGLTTGTVVVCVRCGHAAVADPPETEVFEGAYVAAEDAVSLEEEAGQVATAARDLEWLERWVQPGRLLDIGCWTGSMLVAAMARGWTAEGLEPSRWACARASERGCTVRQATLEEAELRARSYRAVVATDVVEHVIDPARALAAVHDALEADGVVFLTVPDAGSTVARVLGRRWWSVLPMHVHYFTRNSMTTLLRRSGFRVEAVQTHPKAFSVGYYLDRLATFAPMGGTVLRGTRGRAWRQRLVAPNFRDRMAVVARKVSTS